MESTESPPAEPESVFVGCLTANGMIDMDAAQAVMIKASNRRGQCHSAFVASSLINMNCNALWAGALEIRESKGVRWFAMLHSDVAPEINWLDKLIDEATAHDADILACHVSIKDGRGIYSTAIANPLDPWQCFARVTHRQAHHEEMPDTVDMNGLADALEKMPEPYGFELGSVPRHRLLVNTGCMVARIDRPWAEKVHFETKDKIERNAEGKLQPYVQPEDWCFSRMAADHGAKVMVTRKVRVIHKGIGLFDSHRMYGMANSQRSEQ